MNKKVSVIMGVFIFALLFIFNSGTINASETKTLYPDYIKDAHLANILKKDFGSIDRELTDEQFNNIAGGVDELIINSCDQIDTYEGMELLYNLEELSIYNCSLDTIPEEVNELTNLKSLMLNAASLEKIENIDNLQNLETLKISMNKITSLEGIENLQNLTRLEAGSNKIDDINILDDIGSLEYVVLAINDISSIPSFENLGNLTYLDLGRNSITAIEGLDNLNKLVDLYIDENKITKIEGVDSLVNLQILDLGVNNISKIENLDNLDSIVKVSLEYNDISKIEGFENLDHINTIYLNGNHISKIEGLDHITELLRLDLRSETIEVYLPTSSVYDEVFQSINCTDTLCLMNFNNYRIDGNSYSDTVSSTTYNIVSTKSDDLLHIEPGNGYMNFDADITINPINQIEAQDYDDDLATAASSEDELFTKLQVSVTNSTTRDLNEYIYISDLDGYDVSNPVPGNYEITFSLNNPNEDVDIDADFSSLDKTVTYTVTKQPTLTSNDMEVYISDAPNSINSILEMFGVELTDEWGDTYSGEDLSLMNCIIDDLDGYDIDNPEFGDYSIVIKYTDNKGNELTQTSNLGVRERVVAELPVAERPEIESPEVELPETTQPEAQVPGVEEPEAEVTVESIEEDNEIKDTGIENNMFLVYGLIACIFILLIYLKQEFNK